MKKKLNVKKLIAFICACLIIAVLLICLINSLITKSNYKKTYDYKLNQIGYSINEVELIKNELESNQIEKLLNIKYDTNITKLISENYFIFSNLEKYIIYKKENQELSNEEVIGIVNVKENNDWYENIKDTDTSKGTLMIVNKFYGLSEEYEPEDLIEVSSMYAYNGKKVSEIIYDDLKSMLNAAKEAGYTLVVNQGYRSYSEQEEAYEDLKDYKDEEYAETYAARKGHSEYQTGLSVQITPYNKVIENNTETEEQKWLAENAYKYGFILRYPKEKEEITGFQNDEYRFRYVGKEVAKDIYEKNITFDEYYAYYLNR